MTQSQTIRTHDSTESNRLYIALELSNKKWKIASGNGMKVRCKTIIARDLEQFKAEIERAKMRFKIYGEVQIHSCYEAGRDGFWIHRFLLDQGISNIVVDSSSIEVNRRYRRAKTDRLDAQKLLTMLIRYVGGEAKVWRVLHIPTFEQEDQRRLDREIGRLKKERASHSNRIRSLLILHGVDMRLRRTFLKELGQVVLYNGKKFPSRLHDEIVREYRRHQLIEAQLARLESEKAKLIKIKSKESVQVQSLQRLRGIGPVSAWRLVYEFFGWRNFDNGKQVGAAAGLAPTPYDSGGSEREQGISKSGNRRVRAVMIELSWYWLRYQPQSRLSRWFFERYANGSKRIRRIGIVALARKLLVALWRYLQQGIVPEKAAMKVGC